MSALVMSRHAGIRCLQRGFTDDAIAAALAGKCYEREDGATWYVCRRVCLVVASDGAVLTVMWLRKRTVKRELSR